LEQQLREKEARIVVLEQRVAELEAKVHRSVAPFRRRPEQRQSDPKPPGRPKGHAPSYRPLPEAAIQDTLCEPLGCCPHCQGPVADLQPVEQVLIDLPPVAPQVFRLLTYTGKCPQCGPVRSVHPQQVSTATGAAGYQLGPRALAVAATLRYGHGLPLRRVSALLGDLFGLRVSHAGVYEALARLAQPLAAEYATLQAELRRSESVHGDETGWWLSYRHGWLWVFATRGTTVYRVTRKRSVEAIQEVLGERFDGVLVSDCLRVYDKYEAAAKSKCVAHHLRVIRAALAKCPESRFLVAVQRLLQAALKLQRAYGWLPDPVYWRGVASLEARLTKLLAPTYAPQEEERVAQRLRRQREHLFTFLHHPAVEATNNLAERQLRPAVISRKLSYGNATERGARTLEVLGSLAVTCRQRGLSFIALIANRAKLGSVPGGLSPPAAAAGG
jgi:transposase